MSFSVRARTVNDDLRGLQQRAQMRLQGIKRRKDDVAGVLRTLPALSHGTKAAHHGHPLAQKRQSLDAVAMGDVFAGVLCR